MSRWRYAEAADLQRVAGALRRREWAYVPFSARLTATGRASLRLPRRSWRVALEPDAAEHPSAVLVTRSGLVLPALRDGRPLPPALRPLIEGACRSPHTVMGTRSDVLRVQHLLGRGYAMVDYTLMTLAAAGFRRPRPQPPPELRIHRARPRHARRLFELQRAYELEEVLLDRSRFDGALCRRLLHRSLQRQLIYFGTVGGHPVTKAGTNARGFAADQIGGVFTEPVRRGRGYGGAVLAALLRELFAAGRSAALFVKPRNATAIRLYENLGFVARDRYRICYYRS